MFSTLKYKLRRVQQRERIILKNKHVFFPRFPHSGGTRLSSGGFNLGSLERKLCNIAFPLSVLRSLIRKIRRDKI